jgi:hypothetical protein
VTTSALWIQTTWYVWLHVSVGLAQVLTLRKITLGDEGFGLAGDGSYPYQFSEGLDFAANLALPNISFGTFHLYPQSWGTTNDWGNGWIQAHAKVCAKLGKPCLFEEYGVPSQHCSVEGGWQNTSLGLKVSLSVLRFVDDGANG